MKKNFNLYYQLLMNAEYHTVKGKQTCSCFYAQLKFLNFLCIKYHNK
jgi:hypothetical protein